MANNPALLPLSALCGKYELGEEIGRGQYGVILRCTERATGRQFACKVVTGRPNAIDGAMREVRAFSALRDRKSCHVVGLRDAYYESVDGPESLYMVLDLATGGDLLTQIEKRGRIPEREARHIFQDIVMSVRDCHAARIVHRDIKPENVLLFPREHRASAAMVGAAADLANEDRSGATAGAFYGLSGYEARLTDFGICMRLINGRQLTGYAGSFPYEAPEVLALEPYDFAADVWSLGVTLYAMLSGRWPTFANNRRVLDEGKDFDLSSWLMVSHKAKMLIKRMLAVKPQDRPTVDEILEDPWFSRYYHISVPYPQSQSARERILVPVATSSSKAAATSADIHATAANNMQETPATSAATTTTSTPTATSNSATTTEDSSSNIAISIGARAKYLAASSCHCLAVRVLRRNQWRRHAAAASPKGSPKGLSRCGSQRGASGRC
eukprot:TRINITY_DN78253_c0_g1_i1.p1 TRINITY_DN78253_c0_g1~~TRINITY_DN78253_c0_g1_i1.p1  ORF type:complete len:441 (+),score=-16.07 TRINITY_DN78253_c0_g1_i1:174-1496(+)